MKKTRTRFAPSPTGYMHVGNLRSALFTYLIAKHDGGDFILRIEDTDQERKVEGAIDVIYDTLNLCGLEVDEGPKNPGESAPYIQSERLNLYQKYAHELVKKGRAYYCFCTEERLASLRKEAELLNVAFMYDGRCQKRDEVEIKELLEKGTPYVIRQAISKEGEITYDDAVYGEITVKNEFMEDQILLKSDGYPTYNFANVVDDHLMGITHVIRGNEYLSSTPKYILLYEAFGWEAPKFIHLPHIIKEGGKKLSKRENDASFIDLYNEGYLPKAIINYLALLGWSPKDNKEIFSLDELVKVFDIKRINKSPAVYDVNKLRWINQKYLKELPFVDFKKLVIPFLNEAYNLEEKSTEWLDRLLEIYQSHLSYGKEIVEEVYVFFHDNIKLSDEAKEILAHEEVLDEFKREIQKNSEWTEEEINQTIRNVQEKTGVKGKMLYMPIRIKVSGYMHGPELAATIYLIGKEQVLRRLDESL